VSAQQFSFGPEFQRALLRLAMVDDAFAAKAAQYLDSDFFTTKPFGWAYTQQKRYYEQHGARCTDMPLREVARKQPEYAAEVEAIIAIGPQVPEAGFIKAELQEFVRRNIFARAHVRSQEAYNAGRHSVAYDITCRAMDELRQVEFDAPDRSWFFDELPERQKRRVRDARNPTEGVYSTGVAQIDDLLDGGVRRGELHFVLAPPKVGKTVWLVNQAFVNTRVGRKPTLYLNLEGGTKLIEDRLDACFSTELFIAVRRGEIRPALYNEIVGEYRQLRKLLVIRTINDFDITIQHLLVELKELEASGFKPEVLVVDYVDKMRSRDKAGSELEHQTGATNDLKRLANRGYLVWTACQTQRPKEGDEDREFLIKASQIADAYSKVRIADGYGSINQTRAEKARGVYRYYLENARSAAVGKVFLLRNEVDRMRLAVEAEEYRSGATAASAPAVVAEKKR
jgi:KaiC/GvpD/RAD55 family RecA-like ATPase